MELHRQRKTTGSAYGRRVIVLHRDRSAGAIGGSTRMRPQTAVSRSRRYRPSRSLAVRPHVAGSPSSGATAEIGRASGRESVCQCVAMLVVAQSITKKITKVDVVNNAGLNYYDKKQH